MARRTGKVAFSSAFVTDITERKQIEEEKVLMPTQASMETATPGPNFNESIYAS